MQWIRLILTFVVNNFLVMSGYIMYSNGNRVITGNIWGSSLTIAAVMTLVIWLVWNFEVVMQMLKRIYQGTIEKRKHQIEDEVLGHEHTDELLDIRQRFQHLEDKIAISHISEDFSEQDAELMTVNEAIPIKTR